MCVTNIYTDVYPDNRSVEFRQTSICQYGLPGRPCQKTSTLQNPVRKIQWGEPSTEYMLTSHQRAFPVSTFPNTPPRSSAGSNNRRSGGGYSSSGGEEGGQGRQRRDSKRGSREVDRRPEPIRRATREHRKERIIIVDSPPTPRTPPQVFNQVFTAPNSPATRSGRPIIVDERPRPPPLRNPSVGAVVGDRGRTSLPIPIIRRSRSSSRPRTPLSPSPLHSSPRTSSSRFPQTWESPSSSHTSFTLQTRLEEEQRDRERRQQQARERDTRIAEIEADRRRASFIAAQDEEIRRRPAVPLAPVPPPRLRNREYLHPSRPRDRVVVDQNITDSMAALNVRVVEGELAEARRIREERERAARLRQEAQQEEAMRQRLRERQLPTRRFSVGPAMRRHRVLYDDGVYRWE